MTKPRLGQLIVVDDDPAFIEYFFDDFLQTDGKLRPCLRSGAKYPIPQDFLLSGFVVSEKRPRIAYPKHVQWRPEFFQRFDALCEEIVEAADNAGPAAPTWVVWDLMMPNRWEPDGVTSRAAGEGGSTEWAAYRFAESLKSAVGPRLARVFLVTLGSERTSANPLVTTPERPDVQAWIREALSGKEGPSNDWEIEYRIGAEARARVAYSDAIAQDRRRRLEAEFLRSWYRTGARPCVIDLRSERGKIYWLEDKDKRRAGWWSEFNGTSEGAPAEREARWGEFSRGKLRHALAESIEDCIRGLAKKESRDLLRIVSADLKGFTGDDLANSEASLARLAPGELTARLELLSAERLFELLEAGGSTGFAFQTSDQLTVSRGTIWFELFVALLRNGPLQTKVLIDPETLKQIGLSPRGLKKETIRDRVYDIRERLGLEAITSREDKTANAFTYDAPANYIIYRLKSDDTRYAVTALPSNGRR